MAFDDADWDLSWDNNAGDYQNEDEDTIRIRTVDLFPDEDETTRRLCPWCYEPSTRQVNGLDWCDKCNIAHKYLRRRSFADAMAERQAAATGKPAGKPVVVTINGVKVKVMP